MEHEEGATLIAQEEDLDIKILGNRDCLLMRQHAHFDYISFAPTPFPVFRLLLHALVIKTSRVGSLIS
jgi:hypothetical protein